LEVLCIIGEEKDSGNITKKNLSGLHINGNNQDNRKGNLLVCHKWYHGWLEAKIRRLKINKKDLFPGRSPEIGADNA
jgi:hypothetical protein